MLVLSTRKISDACCFCFAFSATEGRSAASRQSRIASSRNDKATQRQPPLVPRSRRR